MLGCKELNYFVSGENPLIKFTATTPSCLELAIVFITPVHTDLSCCLEVRIFVLALCSCCSSFLVFSFSSNYPAVNAIFPAIKHYFFLQNVFKCCQKIVIYLFRLFTHSMLSYLN